MRILFLATDAFGGRGGIAQYARDLVSALSTHSRVDEIVVVPRHQPDPPGDMPRKVRLISAAARGKVAYTLAVARELARSRDFDLVVSAHINLLWLARLTSMITRAPVVLMIYGIDVWRSGGMLTRASLRGVTRVVAISRHTLERFRDWSNATDQFTVLPNAIRMNDFGTSGKNPQLLKRYGLEGKRILLTVGRLASKQRYKGFDEVIDVLDDLPSDVVYLIVGEGNDRPRLEARVREKGLAGRVVFAGYIPEGEKADHYRLADAYVMPSSGEGFGFVFLEALACGVPVVASKNDGGREAVLEGKMGLLVDPRNQTELRQAILAALEAPRVVPPDLNHFSFDNFQLRCHTMLDEITRA